MRRKRKEQWPSMMTVAEAAELLGVSRQAIWDAIRRGRIQALRFRRAALVSRDALVRYDGERKEWAAKVKRKKDKGT